MIDASVLNPHKQAFSIHWEVLGGGRWALMLGSVDKDILVPLAYISDHLEEYDSPEDCLDRFYYWVETPMPSTTTKRYGYAPTLDGAKQALIDLLT
jgi:hypothetical protein